MKKNYPNFLISALILANFLTAFYSFYIASSMVFPDEAGYLAMSQGLYFGKFSSWFELNKYYPETLRTPGYPLFLCLIKFFLNSNYCVKIIQFGFYFFALFLAFRILNKITQGNKIASYAFLVLTLFNIQVPFYAGYIGSDSLNIFFLILYLYIITVKKTTIKSAVLLGVVGTCSFQLRPAFLLLPCFLTFSSLFFQKEKRTYFSIHLGVFMLLLIPFSIWNLENHKIFKPTPLEGGAGVAHLGYWSFKLPANYTESYYWGNNTGNDLLNPFYFSINSRIQSKIEFEKEWTDINKKTSMLLSKMDSQNLAIMKVKNNIFPLYNSEYTKKREELLKEKLIYHIKQDYIYYIISRIYSFCRVYFTGINKNEFYKNGLKNKINTVYPFFITFLSVFMGLILFSIYLFKHKFKVKNELIVTYLICFYFGFVHIPFAIQARFTLPIHLCMFILDAYLISIAFSSYFLGKVKSYS